MGFLQRLFGAGGPKPPRACCHSEEDGSARHQEPAEPIEISAANLQQQLASDRPPQLVDVREPHELHSTGWIPGSIHIPMGQIESRFGELDASRPVVVQCASGMRSFSVGSFLLEQGFQEVYNLTGGINAWRGPIER